MSASLPHGCRWSDLLSAPKESVLAHYQDTLTKLGKHATSEIVRDIFAFPTTVFSHSENLAAVVRGLADIPWESIKDDHLGEVYEELLERNSQDVRSGAGQYFTPRALIRSIVKAVKPSPGEVIQDPATGSGGFLTASNSYVRKEHSAEVFYSRRPRYQGAEIEKNTRRICLMNCYLNDISSDILLGDALTEDAAHFEPADLILANPPFGSRVGGKRKLRASLKYKGANKQLLFLQHIYLNLKEGGRAAVVVPDNVLFEDGVGKQIRQELMECCHLHTILRLPTGIFYSASVNTNVLFFSKEEGDTPKTKDVWVFDLRSNMVAFGRTRPLEEEDFAEFLLSYGADPHGRSERTDTGNGGRFRAFTRREIERRDYNLDISWLEDRRIDTHRLELGPEDLIASIFAHLNSAVNEMDAFTDELVAGSKMSTEK